MKLSIVQKQKKDIFISLFQLLKNCSSAINIIFKEDQLYIQGMDKSHVCLFDIIIFSSWFSSYDYGISSSSAENKICVDTTTFYNVLTMNQENHAIFIYYDNDSDSDCVHIDLIDNSSKKGEFDRFFRLPLTDADLQLLEIPVVDYDAEFSIPSKKICEIASQLLLFGDTINIKCTEERIDLFSNGVNGLMTVNIPIDDLSEFSISEGEIIELEYSLNYIQKMCLTTKLSSEISFSVSDKFPMQIKYDLGENSQAIFFIAPKIME